LFVHRINIQIRSYKNKPFDLVFIDPPYKKSLADKALKVLTEKENLLSNKAVLAAETSFDEELSEKYGEFELQKCAKYGTILPMDKKSCAKGKSFCNV
jgi:16S rRNA G966 N2-methylase RsmD